MARNSEKAMTALARWRRAKEEEEEGFKKPSKRPYLATECDNLAEAEKWRGQVIREISKNVTAIQNAGLGEFRIRDLNDHINKLLREKRHWEDRIKELGGRTFARTKMLDREGKEVPGNRGYKYFGAARDLPGVRELFETETASAGRRTRAELMKEVDAQYYGFRDDDDGLLVPLEVEVEKDAIRKAVEEYKEKKGIEDDDDVDIYFKDTQDTDLALEEAMKAGKETRFTAHVAIPTQKDVEDALLRRKKQELLELLAIDATVDEIEQDSGMEESQPEKDSTAPASKQTKKMDTDTPASGDPNEEMKPPGDD
eukprot:TRINITY_DN2384_c0_g1_i12.p1 TRINITY_DN2384_c0_g1~~TRINITY_DN2384_c0_g1_i12.p1  ORF type:complete len:312 (+),score=114.96 TRINITY_DN2384_c0_g1_i12:383-1318(+)